jgi:transcriptional regulator with XRE-family HTH domain
MDNFIRRTRLALNLSQVEFARLIGKSHQSVQGYEKAGSAPEDVMQRIRALAVEKMLVSEVAEIDGSPSPVAALRGHLGMDAKSFARDVGCTVAELSVYESGGNVERVHLRRMQELAREKDLITLAVQLGGEEWNVDRIHHPTGHVVHQGKRAASPSSPYAPANAPWHDLLEEVLESGNDEAKGAVQSNLVVFGKYVRASTRPASKKSTVR